MTEQLEAFLKQSAEENPQRRILCTERQNLTARELYDRFCRYRKQFLVQGEEKTCLLYADHAFSLLPAYLAAISLNFSAIIVSEGISKEDLLFIDAVAAPAGCVRAGRYSPLKRKPASAPLCRESVFATSGTGGKPKYVRIANENCLKRACAQYPFTHIGENRLLLMAVALWRQLAMQEMLRAVLCGGALCVPENLHIAGLLRCFRAHAVTDLAAVSHLIGELLQSPSFQLRDWQELCTIRYCLEPLQYETLIQVQSLFPGMEFYSDYGLTESVGTIAVLGPEEHLEAMKNHYLPSTGPFLPQAEARIAESGEEKRKGNEIGELMIHTPWQYNGYLGQEDAPYWIAAGDIGWMDGRGQFNLSGFHLTRTGSSKEELYILPASLRNKYMNIPYLYYYDVREDGSAYENFQSLLMLVHGALDPYEVHKIYCEWIVRIIPADAYDIDLFVEESDSPDGISGENSKWYKNAMDSFLVKTRIKRNVQEPFCWDDSDSYAHILYVPLYSSTSFLHGRLAFGRKDPMRPFTSSEIIMVKQISHHLNIAVLNARRYQEQETRQLLMEQTLNLSGIGTILSDRESAVYYLNDVAKDLLDKESPSVYRSSLLLERLQENILILDQRRLREHTLKFGIMLKDSPVPAIVTMRSLYMQEETDFITTFLNIGEPCAQGDFGSLNELLTSRELEVFELLFQGKSYKEIAGALRVSVNTVNFHIKNIYRKMNVTSRTEALNLALFFGNNGIRYISGTDHT